MSALVRSLAVALPFAIAACGAPAAPPAVAPTPATQSAPAALPAAPETPDAAFRYVPPGLWKATTSTLAPVEVRLANGLAGRFAEARSVPVVHATVVVRWSSAAPVAGTAKMLGELLEEAKLASGRTLREELADLGTAVRVYTVHDATFFSVGALHPLIEQALDKVLAALRSGKLDQAALDRERKAALPFLEKASARDRFDRTVGEHLFPASHLYHDPTAGTVDSLKKLKIEDLTRYRDAAVTPDVVSVAAVGAMSQPDFSAMLERLAGSWAAPKPGAKSAARGTTPIPKGPTHGVFLVEDRTTEDTHVTLAFPAPQPGHGDLAAATVAWSVAVGRVLTLLDERLQGQWQRSNGRTFTRRETSLLQWLGEVKQGNAAGAVDVALQAIDGVAKGDISDAELARARSFRANRALGDDGFGDTAMVLAAEASMLSRPGIFLDDSAAVRVVTRQEVIHAAQTYLKKELASVVAVGDVVSERAAMEKLGLGPVTVPGEKKAQDKGAKK